MSTPFTLFDPTTPQTGWRRYFFPVCISMTLFFVILEFIIIIVIAYRTSVALNDLTPMTSEVQATLEDVRTVLPEMRISLKILGQMLPDVKQGMKILNELCHNDQYCKV